MKSLPKRPVGNSAEAIFMQAVWDALFGGKFPLKDTADCIWDRGQQSYSPILKIRGGGGGRSGLRFSTPREYDPETLYAVDEIVVVSPNNPLVTVGVANPDDEENNIFGVPGLYVCWHGPVIVRDEEGAIDPDITNLRVPTWPPCGFEDTDDIPADYDPDGDVPAVYWFPLSFYPKLEPGCNEDDEPVTFAVNGQVKPTEPA